VVLECCTRWMVCEELRGCWLEERIRSESPFLCVVPCNALFLLTHKSCMSARSSSHKKSPWFLSTSSPSFQCVFLLVKIEVGVGFRVGMPCMGRLWCGDGCDTVLEVLRLLANFECHWFIFLPCDYSFLRNRTLKMSRPLGCATHSELGVVVCSCTKCRRWI